MFEGGISGLDHDGTGYIRCVTNTVAQVDLDCDNKPETINHISCSNGQVAYKLRTPFTPWSSEITKGQTVDTDAMDHFLLGKAVEDFADGIRASDCRGVQAFHTNDLVRTMDGQVARIIGFDLYVDPSDNWSTVAAVLSTNPSTVANLSGLSLVSPATELNKTAEKILADLRGHPNKELKARQNILQYAYFQDLKDPFQSQVIALEKGVAVYLDQKIGELKLDPRGATILKQFVEDRFDFHHMPNNPTFAGELPSDY